MSKFCCVIHIGEKIREVVDIRGMSITEFAKRIHKSSQNAYKIFASPSVNTELLTDISKVLDYNFFSEIGDKVFPKSKGKEDEKKISINVTINNVAASQLSTIQKHLEKLKL